MLCYGVTSGERLSGLARVKALSVWCTMFVLMAVGILSILDSDD